MSKTTSGIDDFRDFLSDYREVGTIGLLVAVVLPFLPALAGASPPWPSHAAFWTSALEIVTLVITYFAFSNSSRKRISRFFYLAVPATVIALIIYLVLFSLFVFSVPTTNEKVVAGFQCTSHAEKIAAKLGQECPFLNHDLFASATYEADRIWTKPSIAVIQVLLFTSWVTAFLTLMGIISAFIAYQRTKRFKKSTIQGRH